jgi:protein-S-isoprenylcysteine O-methyltransferase Ste14
MSTDLEAKWRLAVGTLLGLAIAMRLFFHLRLALQGEALLPDKNAIQQEGRLSLAIRVLGFLLMLALLALFAVDSPRLRFAGIALPQWIRWAGLLIGVGSVAFWTWTHVALGRFWSAQLTLRQDHQLVTVGPYRWVRHPMYAALFVWITCVALVAANWLFVVFALATIAMLLARTPKEEAMMLQAFGARYSAYASRTGRFFPKLNHPAEPGSPRRTGSG